MRLIDADALVTELNEAQVEYDEYYKGLGKAKVITENAPTVPPDMAQVLAYASGKASALRPKGKWKMGDKNRVYCSVCNGSLSISRWIPSFSNCPFCGADMRKGDTE